MRKLLVLPVVLAVLALSACGGKAKLQQAETNPQVKQQATAAETIIQGCVSKGNFLTHGDRKAILRCIAPPGHEAAFQKCAAQDVAHHSLVTQRQKIYNELATCLERNR